MSEPRRTLRTAAALVEAGLVPARDERRIARVGARYAIAITPEMASLIDRDDAGDPIARQFVPDERELVTTRTERADPIGDRIKSPAPGIVHRYHDRVLLKIAHVCPVYCRFCFRREMVGPDLGEALSPDELEAALAYISAHANVREVILTGGDPFILSPRRISEVTAALGAIPHIDIVRWHTRVPVVAPERVTEALVEALKASAKTVWVAVHTNHVRELTDDARRALAQLIEAGIPLVSQSVLLRGVNDDAETLEALFRELIKLRVKPYYLHHGDLAPGTSHFRVPVAEGQALMRELRQRLSGLALPSYVIDIPGAHGKVPLETFAKSLGNGRTAIEDSSGLVHLYDDCCAAPAAAAE